MRRSRLLAACTAALLALTLAACGDDDGGDDAATDPRTATSTETATSEPAAPDCSDDATVPGAAKKFGKEPAIDEPSGPPPCELVVEDLTEGEGEPVEDITKAYDWNYEGVSWSTGEVFDSSFRRGDPIAFSLDQVIPGWTEGLEGIKPGGRRLLVIPPDKAYGELGSPPAIGPNETLVFVVDLVGAE